jgi:hypothetical protein
MTHDARGTGRMVGLFLLLQASGAFVVNALLLRPIFRAPGFLENAVAHPMNIPSAMLLNIALALFMLTAAFYARPYFKQISPRLALAHVAIVTAGLSLSIAENVGLFAMQNVSEANAVEPVAHGVRLVAASVRNGAHFSYVFTAGIGLFVMYLLMYKGRLIPRLIAGAGMLASLSQMVAVGTPFFGGSTNATLLMPLGVVQLVLVVWLLAKGFAPVELVEHAEPAHAHA